MEVCLPHPMLKDSRSDKLHSSGPTECSAPTVRGARRATYAMFFADGIGFGIWAGHIPAFKQKFQLSDSSLSIVLLAVAAGSIISMPIAGQAVRHFGSRRCIAVSIACYGLCLVAIALAPSQILFVVAALLFGAAKGGVDVGINAQAVVVERCYGRTIMSSFQALWSVGGLAGGFLTSAALGLGSTAPINLTCIGLLILLLDLLYYCHLMRYDASSQEGEKRFRLPGKALLFVAILTFIALFSEGVLQDWAAVYMRQVVSVPIWIAAVAYAGYSTAMALGRFLGDRVVAVLGERFLMRLSGALIIVGLAAALLVPTPLFGIAGFAVAGLGNSNLVPILFSAAGRDPVLGPGPGIAAVTTVGFLGFLIGPAMIGLMSKFFGLSVALSLVALLGLITAVCGPAIIQSHALSRIKV
jgi:MFS family permease